MKKGFTLIELLVVVLIIGILASIAVPQYQKAVLKANLHKGVSLVESIYQAQQAYFLAHGDFATDLTDLDITIPKDDSCDPAKTTFPLSYTCSWGRLYSNKNLRNIYFLPNQDIAYVKFFKDDDTEGVDFEAGKRYCYARPYKPTAISVCENMGATYIGELPDIWKFYALD